MDLGQGRRGVDMGPSAIRYARMEASIEELGHPVTDLGNARVPIPELVESDESVRHLDAVRAVCEEVAERAEAVVSEGLFPIFLGGGHSITVGTVSGVARPFGGRTGVIWLDAHADFNTPETSPSGNIHGMPLATLTGNGPPGLVEIGGPGASVSPEDVVLIGLRSVDLEELDPETAPGVGTPVRGGLTYREAHLVMELINEAGVVTSLDVVEVNPILDVRNGTAALAVELVESLLGRRIIDLPV